MAWPRLTGSGPVIFAFRVSNGIPRFWETFTAATNCPRLRKPVAASLTFVLGGSFACSLVPRLGFFASRFCVVEGLWIVEGFIAVLGGLALVVEGFIAVLGGLALVVEGFMVVLGGLALVVEGFMAVLGGLALVVEGFIVVLGGLALVVEGFIVVLGPVVLGALTPVDGPPFDRPVVLGVRWFPELDVEGREVDFGACLPPGLVAGRAVVWGARTVDGLTLGLDP
jgi:hypothetical protein